MIEVLGPKASRAELDSGSPSSRPSARLALPVPLAPRGQAVGSAAIILAEPSGGLVELFGWWVDAVVKSVANPKSQYPEVRPGDPVGR